MTGTNPEDTLSAALRARASGRSGPPRRAPQTRAGRVLLFVIVLGLLAGLLAAGVTVFYPVG